MARFIHTADWQIGKLYGQFEPDDAALLAEARFAVVERIAALAGEHAVDFILVAGDVFDAQGVSDRTVHRLFNAMRSFAGPWILIPGNHDSGLAESVWTRAQRLRAVPDNVTVCLRAETLLLAAHSVAILPAPLTQRHTFSDLTDWFDQAETPDTFLRIGLAHGSVQGILAENIDSSNPIAEGRAGKARLDYLALGDWHGTRQVDARTWYSGTPETDRFKDNDSGQVLLVEIAGPQAQPVVQAIPTGQYRWTSEDVVLQVPSDLDRFVEQLATLAASDVAAFRLSGESDLAGNQRLQDAVLQAQGRARSLSVDTKDLLLAPTNEDIDGLKADGYLGEVVQELRDEQSGPDGQDARDALAVLAGLLAKRSPLGEKA